MAEEAEGFKGEDQQLDAGDRAEFCAQRGERAGDWGGGVEVRDGVCEGGGGFFDPVGEDGG